MSLCYCDTCDYSTNNKSNFNRHLQSLRHKNGTICNTKRTKNVTQKNKKDFKNDCDEPILQNQIHKHKNRTNENQKQKEKEKEKENEKEVYIHTQYETKTDTQTSPHNENYNTLKVHNNNIQDNVKMKPHGCPHCNKYFRHHSAFYRHRKHYCREKEKGDMEKLVKLLNQKTFNMDNKNEIQTLVNSIISKEDQPILGATFQKKEKTATNNIVYVQGDQHNTLYNENKINNIINFNNYNETNYEMLKERDYLKCFLENNHCVKKLIETVHFNEKNPENMNIYISSIKGNYIMVYKENSWQLKDRKFYVDDLYENNEIVLENWYDMYKQKYPQIIHSFERYLLAKEDDEYMNNIKREIILMLYNNRSKVIKHKNEIVF